MLRIDYLMNEKAASNFRKKEDFEFNFEGSRENYKSGIIHVREVAEKKMFIGIKNPDNLYGIHVGIEVVALVKTQELQLKKIRSPLLTVKKIPYTNLTIK